MQSAGIKLALTALIFYAFFGLVLSDQVYPKVSLTSSDRAALAWVSENIPQRSRFIILTGETEAFADAIAEWFPVLAKSVSISTIQGYEWMPDKLFLKKMDEYYALQICLNKTYVCIEEWAAETKQDFDYVLISQNSLSESENSLITSLTASSTYQLIYQKADVAIFKKNH